MAGQFTWLGENVAEAYMEKLREQNAAALLLGGIAVLPRKRK